MLHLSPFSAVNSLKGCVFGYGIRTLVTEEALPHMKEIHYLQTDKV